MSSTASLDKLELPNGIRNIGGTALGGKYGIPIILKETAQTAAQTTATTGLISFTPTKVTGRYIIGGNMVLNSGTNTGTVQFTINYVDSAGTTHTQDVLSLQKADGTIVQTGTAASTDWKVCQTTIQIDNSGTAISVDILVTGSVHFLASAYLMQIG